jgi:hypothetical protein
MAHMLGLGHAMPCGTKVKFIHVTRHLSYVMPCHMAHMLGLDMPYGY